MTSLFHGILYPYNMGLWPLQEPRVPEGILKPQLPVPKAYVWSYTPLIHHDSSFPLLLCLFISDPWGFPFVSLTLIFVKEFYILNFKFCEECFVKHFYDFIEEGGFSASTVSQEATATHLY